VRYIILDHQHPKVVVEEDISFLTMPRETVLHLSATG
jgi:hypothetical protein